MRTQQLYLIDATAFCYRAFYALKGLTTSFGQPTNAVYGFITILHKILKEEKPDYLAVCFDVSRDTFRQKKFAEYKIQRPPMPEGLSSQLPLIKEILAFYGIKVFEKEGFEADDVIATLARQAKEKNIKTVIVSSDKDILQLVDEDTVVLSPHKDENKRYDIEKVVERFGVKPAQVADVIALMGDSVDNIPGIPGIGEKTALELIRTFGSLEGLLENIEALKSEKIKHSVKEHIATVHLNSELVKLDTKVDITVDFEALKPAEPRYDELFKVFKRLEFKSLVKQLPVPESAVAGMEVAHFSDDEVGALAEKTEELFLFQKGDSALAAAALDQAFLFGEIGAQAKLLLENEAVKKAGHDLKKIKLKLAAKEVELKGICFDTMIAAYLLNPSKTDYKLSDLAWEFLKQPLQEEALDEASALGLLKELKPVLERSLEEKGLTRLFTELEVPLIEVLAVMELTGIGLDVKALKELSKQLETRLIKLVEEIYQLSQTQFNINSPKQLREVLFERLKLPVVKRTKTGPSTDEEVLKALSSKHPLPALLLEYRQVMKLKSTYVDALPALVDPQTMRVHTSFNQAGTETGRLSSSNPNLQNLPIKTELGKNIRRAVIARGNDWLVSCDYSQIELRILAHLSKDEQLIKAFKEGKDIHKATAALVFGVDEPTVSDEMRNNAKRVNFGIIYGLTSFGLSRDLSLPPKEAQNFIDNYFLRYPRVQEYIQSQIEHARKYGFVSTILGRRRYLPEIDNKNLAIRSMAERQAMNTPIQGTASDLIKLAMIDIHKKIRQQKFESRMVLQIHDELLFEVPEKEKGVFLPLVKKSMEEVLTLAVPVIVDMKTGRNWLEMDEVTW